LLATVAGLWAVATLKWSGAAFSRCAEGGMARVVVGGGGTQQLTASSMLQATVVHTYITNPLKARVKVTGGSPFVKAHQV
jgi:hypothetical protein